MQSIPISICDHLPHRATFSAHAHSDATPSRQSLHSVPIGIDDHMLLRTAIPTHAHSSAHLSETSSRRVTISLDDRVFGSPSDPQHGLSQDPSVYGVNAHPSTKKDGNSAHLVDVLESSLKEAGIEQSTSDFVIQSIKMCFDHSIDTPTRTIDPTTQASQWRDRDGKSEGYGSHGAKVLMTKTCTIKEDADCQERKGRRSRMSRRLRQAQQKSQ
jgi:hypothetical protein